MTRAERSLDRLPKWAADEIRILRAEVEYRDKQIAEMNGGTSRIAFGYGERSSPKGYVPETEPIIFTVGAPWDKSRDGPEARITVNLRPAEDRNRSDYELSVMGGDAIDVLPLAANHIRVRIRDDGRFADAARRAGEGGR